MSKSYHKYWWKKAFAPEDSVPVQSVRHVDALFYFLQSNYDLMTLWPYIKKSTESGKLGHYSAFSNDRKVIVVHYSDATDEQQKSRILLELKKLGIDEPLWDTQANAHGGDDQFNLKHSLEYEQEYELDDIDIKFKPRHWTDWAFASKDVERPTKPYEGAIVFFSFEDFNNIEELWPQIKQLTETHFISYLSTTDNEIIALHCSTIDQMVRTYNQLNKLVVKNIRMITEVKALCKVETAFKWIEETGDSSEESEEMDFNS